MGVLSREREASMWETYRCSNGSGDLPSCRRNSSFGADPKSLRKIRLVHHLAFTFKNIMTSVRCLRNLGWIFIQAML